VQIFRKVFSVKAISKSKRGRFSFREDRKLIQMAAGSATLEQVAAMFGTSVETIERKAAKLGLAFKRRDDSGRPG
jgi:hypothetical protein